MELKIYGAGGMLKSLAQDRDAYIYIYSTF